MHILNYFISVISFFPLVCSINSTKNGLDLFRVFSYFKGVNRIGYTVLWFMLLSMFTYFTFNCNVLESFFYIMITYSFLTVMKHNYTLGTDPLIIDIPISEILNPMRFPVCISSNSYYSLIKWSWSFSFSVTIFLNPMISTFVSIIYNSSSSFLIEWFCSFWELRSILMLCVSNFPLKGPWKYTSATTLWLSLGKSHPNGPVSFWSISKYLFYAHKGFLLLIDSWYILSLHNFN